MHDDLDRSDRTFGNERRLPRVPLPTLAATCSQFLAWCAPLLTPGELSETEQAVAQFLAPDSSAHALQSALRAYDTDDGAPSWLSAFWADRYLGRRDRIALNANFFFRFADPEPAQDQLTRAAGLISAALDHKLALDSESYPPVLQRGSAQTMAQHKFLFSATRIPGEERDSVRAPYCDDWPGPSTARHVLVTHRGQLFALDVLGAGGRPHPAAELREGLAAVLAQAEASDRSVESVGHLTTLARADWARRRAELIDADPGNAATLDVVETALFLICLDEAQPADQLGVCDQLLHGQAGNRWYDKAVSLIVTPRGESGINVEHCELDGTTILQFVDAMAESTVAEHEARSGAVTQGVPEPRAVRFSYDDELRDYIRAAAEDFTRAAADTATTTVSLTGFGQEQIKALKMSPDAFVQLAYQLAHRRSKGLLGSTYESIATRQFRAGRTEAMRVVTPEVVDFVAAMQDTDRDAEQRRDAFRRAADAHVARARRCQAGQAPEQHLWELELLARRRGAELGVSTRPALYDSPGWIQLREDYLSTSSAPSENITYFGFGATSSRCIGVAYVLLADRFHVYLSTPSGVREQMIAFAEELVAAIEELRQLLGEDC